MDINIRIDNPCIERKEFCINCNSHFMIVRPSLRSVVVSRRFIKDLKDEQTIVSVIKNILECAHLEFHELHKFERNMDGNLIFRAKKGPIHIVYGVDKRMRIVFLRAIRNFTEYKKFLEDKREILRMMARADAHSGIAFPKGSSSSSSIPSQLLHCARFSQHDFSEHYSRRFNMKRMLGLSRSVLA